VIITRLENASLLIGKLSRVTCEKVLLRLSLLDSLFSKRSCAAYSLVDIILWESLNTSPPIKREKLSAVGHRNGAKELK
jgi:hypothetical protein